MEEKSLGKHLRVASVGMKVREDISDPTGKSSSVRNELSTVARRTALERCAQGSREVDEGRESRYESGPPLAGVSARWSGERKTLKLSCLLQVLIFTFHHEDHHLYDELRVPMILHR